MTVFRTEEIRLLLEQLSKQYGDSFLPSDPLQIVHRYSSPRDQEVVALLVAVLSYGDARQIIRVAGDFITTLGPHPSETIRGLTVERTLDQFQGFRYRFTRGIDIACLLLLLQEILQRYGSLCAVLESHYRRGQPTIRDTLTSFCNEILHAPTNRQLRRLTRNAPGLRYLLPSPSRGSACKRLNLYMRWMVRDNDGIDLGLIQHIPSSKLVIPLDTHIMRSARILGFTRYRSPSWRCAEDITATLRLFDPDDPLKYDFPLTRLGIAERFGSTKLKQHLAELLDRVKREGQTD